VGTCGVPTAISAGSIHHVATNRLLAAGIFVAPKSSGKTIKLSKQTVQSPPMKQNY